MSENFEQKSEQELTIEDQVGLAKEFKRATDARNDIWRIYPEMDDMSVFLDSDPKNREEYEMLEKEASKAVHDFDDKVKDKQILVSHLRKVGEDELAEIIERRERNLKKFRR